MHFTGQHLADFMAKLGHLKKIKHSKSDYKRICSAGSRVSSRTIRHVKFDKYLDLSIKSGERIRRAGEVECVDLKEISAEIKKPKKLEKFGHRHAANKTNLQQRGLSLASSTPVFAQHDVLLSESVTDEGIVPAQFLRADGLSVPPSIKTS